MSMNKINLERKRLYLSYYIVFMFVKKLSNGLTVLINNNPQFNSVGISAVYNVGSRDEPTEFHGLAHLAEHMFFKGTEKRPSVLAISEALDQYGAQYNASTYYDRTEYYMQISKEKWENGLEILSDIIFNSLFEESVIETEKEVVIHELHQHFSNSSRLSFIAFNKLIFKDTSLGHPVIGNIKTIKQATRDSFLAFVNHFYQPNNGVISICGDFTNTENQAMQLVEKYFDQPFSYPAPKISYHFPPRKLYPNFSDMQKKMRFTNPLIPGTNQSFINIGFPAWAYFSDEYFCVLILSAILGEPVSSRLFISVRTDNGLSYGIGSSVMAFQDLGIFYIACDTYWDQEKIKNCINVILEELHKPMQEGDITDQEIKKAKGYLIGNKILERENPLTVSQDMARDYLLLGKNPTFEEWCARINQIDKDDIVQIARKLFQIDKLNLCVVTPEKIELGDILSRP